MLRFIFWQGRDGTFLWKAQVDLQALQESGVAMRSKIDSSLSVLENLLTAYSVNLKVHHNLPRPPTSFVSSNSQTAPRPEPYIVSHQPPKREDESLDLEPTILTYLPAELAPRELREGHRVQDAILPELRKEPRDQRIYDFLNDGSDSYNGSDSLPEIADVDLEMVDCFLDDASLYVPQAQAS